MKINNCSRILSHIPSCTLSSHSLSLNMYICICMSGFAILMKLFYKWLIFYSFTLVCRFLMNDAKARVKYSEKHCVFVRWCCFCVFLHLNNNIYSFITNQKLIFRTSYLFCFLFSMSINTLIHTHQWHNIEQVMMN